jgi:uncharacterized protein involved in response to NO
MSTTERWRVFTAAPHRMFFASGVAWLLAWSAWWTLLLGARAAGSGRLEPLAPGLVLHGATMLYLLAPPFIYGFLLTVFPRWMPAPEPRRNLLLAAFWLLNLGNFAFLLGVARIAPALTAGWILAAASLALVFAGLLSILLRARERVPHAPAALVGLAAGLLGAGLFLRALLSGDYSSWPLVRGLGLWGFLLVVYFAVCHRMVPFFTSRVVPGYTPWRPAALLWIFVALAIARAALEYAPTRAWLASLPLAVIATACMLRWRPAHRSGVRLLDVLHISMAWLAGGLALAALADLGAALGHPGLVGRAPLHALGMGFVGSMLMAMVTRVSLGHSGRPLTMDDTHWRLFLLVQAATILRVLAEFLPAQAAALGLLAALLWTGAFGTWAARLLPIYLAPRADGAPG